jgi:uncharacterized protein
VTAFLLDVNVLVAFAWPAHVANERVTRWMARHAQEGWATCPFTQAAFVRILSNPAFSPDALTLRDAVALLTTNLKHSAHRFWASDISFSEAIRPFQDRIVGHQQVTDAYLLGLAMHRKGRFATLDRSVLALVPADTPGHGSVELIATGV